MEKQRPIFERRLNGIRIAVWENSGEGGKPWWNVSLTRRYRDSKDSDEWKDANTFNGLSDLAVVQEAVTQAQVFIRERQAELEVVS